MADKSPVAVRSYVFPDATKSRRTVHSNSALDGPLFRFRLRHLLVFVTAVSLMLAGLVTLRGIPAVAVFLAALVVSFHIFSTALGTRLRSNSDREQKNAFSNPREPLVRHSMPAPFYGRESGSLPWLPRLIAVAMLLGGCLGAGCLTLTMSDRTSVAGLAVGGMSLAAISGWVAFLVGHFYATFRSGLREALDDERNDHARM